MLSSVCLHLFIHPLHERLPLAVVHARHKLRNLSDVLLNQLLGAFFVFHIFSMVRQRGLTIIDLFTHPLESPPDDSICRARDIMHE